MDIRIKLISAIAEMLAGRDDTREDIDILMSHVMNIGAKALLSLGQEFNPLTDDCTSTEQEGEKVKYLQ